MDGTLNPDDFHKFGERKRWAGLDLVSAEFAKYDECLEKIGLDTKPKSEKELKKAFRLKCLKLHPDQGGSEAKFRELVDAYKSAKALFKMLN